MAKSHIQLRLDADPWNDAVGNDQKLVADGVPNLAAKGTVSREDPTFGGVRLFVLNLINPNFRRRWFNEEAADNSPEAQIAGNALLSRLVTGLAEMADVTIIDNKTGEILSGNLEVVQLTRERYLGRHAVNREQLDG